MAAVWLEIGLWICRILRILLLLRCLISCFTGDENKVYRAFYKVTMPFTFVIGFPIKKLTGGKKLFFDIDAFAVYVLIWYINQRLMETKVSMGLM